MRRPLIVLVVCAALSCSGNPNAPGGPLGDGIWGGGGACVTVADTCTMTSGCAHGQFPRPTLRDDGTFDVDGTYRIEIGPVSINPAPPAHFSGSVAGSRLTLTVVPSGGSLQPTSYSMTPTTPGTCPIPCV